MGRLDGRIAVVTGSSRGLGKSAARQFAEEGARVCLVDISENTLNEAADEFADRGYEVIAVRADITDESQVQEAVEKAADTWGRIDILVNNAGITRDNLLFKMTDADWQSVMNVHLYGAFVCSKAVQSYMVRQKYGRIINLSSTSALGNRGQANYATAKAGLQGFTKTLAIELGKFGITCNAVAPGFIETDMTKATAERIGMTFEEYVEEQVRYIPAGRSGVPEDVANAILFFASEEASFVNGQVLYVAGGPKV